MRRFLLGVAALLLLALPAHAQWYANTPNGVLQFDGYTVGGKIIPKHTVSDATGALLFSNSNPGYFNCLTGCTSTSSQLATGDALAGTSMIVAAPGLYNGTTFDRQRSVSGDGMAAIGRPAPTPMLYNGTTYDRARAVSGDAQAATGMPAPASMIFNGTTWDRARSAAGDSLSTTGVSGAGNLVFNGTGWDRKRSASGTIGIQAVDTESTKATYSAAATFTIAANSTDFFVLQGSATKTVRIKRITLNSLATIPFQIVRRSSANSGGTSSTVTVGKFDSNDASATAVATSYTANPTGLGTSVAALHAEHIAAQGVSTLGTVIDLNYSRTNDKAIVLRGTSEFLTLNGGGGSTSAAVYVTVEFTEE